MERKLNNLSNKKQCVEVAKWRGPQKSDIISHALLTPLVFGKERKSTLFSCMACGLFYVSTGQITKLPAD